MALMKRLLIPIQIALLLLAAAAVIRVSTIKGKEFSDFHCFWYGGNHIWQGTDPYKAFLERKRVLLPIDYLDGVTVREGPINPHCAVCAPGNTAPMVFLLSPLARYSWQTAGSIWFTVNVLLAVAVGLILLKILNHPPLSRETLFLIPALFLQVSTREVLESGQTSLLVTFCMFGAMLLSGHNRTRTKSLVSGLLLGLAVSKPLLAFPVLLVFLYRRRATEVLTAATVQIAGIWGITLLGTGWRGVLSEYFEIFMMHAGPRTQDGMYLTAGLLKPWMPYSYIIIAAGSIAFGYVLLRLHRGSKHRQGDARTDLILFTVLMLWNFMVFYHRRYDYVAAGAFLAFAIYLYAHPSGSLLPSARERLVFFNIAGAAAVYWTVPAYQILSTMAYRSLFNLCTIAVLVLSTWILFRLREKPWANSCNVSCVRCLPFRGQGSPRCSGGSPKNTVQHNPAGRALRRGPGKETRLHARRFASGIRPMARCRQEAPLQ